MRAGLRRCGSRGPVVVGDVRVLGSHMGRKNGVPGTSFAVWAPNAVAVSVMGDFNGWSRDAHPMNELRHSGIWETFIPRMPDVSRPIGRI